MKCYEGNKHCGKKGKEWITGGGYEESAHQDKHSPKEVTSEVVLGRTSYVTSLRKNISSRWWTKCSVLGGNGSERLNQDRGQCGWCVMKKKKSGMRRTRGTQHLQGLKAVERCFQFQSSGRPVKDFKLRHGIHFRGDCVYGFA